MSDPVTWKPIWWLPENIGIRHSLGIALLGWDP